MKVAVNPNEIGSKEFYKILIGSVLPRPIAWVSSISENGVDNLAPFSFFTIASAKPPILCFSPALKSGNDSNGVEKDTLKNIKGTKEFVVNIVSRNLVQPMNESSFDFEHDVSEFEKIGIESEESIHIKPKRVKGSLIQFECKLYNIVELGTEAQSGALILGEIIVAHLDELVFKEGKIDMEFLDPIGRLGGLWYSGIKDRFELARPKG